MKRGSGQSFVELGAATIIVLPMLLSMLDVAVIAIAAELNDDVCRDSARAAAAGPPAGLGTEMNRDLGSSSEPYQRAMAVVKKVYATNIPAKVRDNITVSETLSDVPPPPQGGAVTGEITIQTTMDVYPPFLVRVLMPNGIALSCRHTVPYTYVVPTTM